MHSAFTSLMVITSYLLSAHPLAFTPLESVSLIFSLFYIVICVSLFYIFIPTTTREKISVGALEIGIKIKVLFPNEQIDTCITRFIVFD